MAVIQQRDYARSSTRQALSRRDLNPRE